VTSFRAGATLPEAGQLITDAELAVAPGAGAVVSRQLPVAVASFAGREDELRALDALLAESSAGNPVVISGHRRHRRGGQDRAGLHWAHRVAGQFGDAAVYAKRPA
jgi:hypothetical protein